MQDVCRPARRSTPRSSIGKALHGLPNDFFAFLRVACDERKLCELSRIDTHRPYDPDDATFDLLELVSVADSGAERGDRHASRDRDLD